MSTKKIQILGGFPQADFNQTDETKSDYIKNKPKLPDDIGDLTATITELNCMSGVTDNVQNQLNTKTQTQIINGDIAEILSTLKIYKISQEEYDQKLANNSLEDNAIYLTPNKENDLSGYVTIEDLNSKADIILLSAQAYTDNAVAQKSQVQIITWEVDD